MGDFDLLTEVVSEAHASSGMPAHGIINESRRLPEPSPSVNERQMFGAMAKPKRRFTFFS